MTGFLVGGLRDALKCKLNPGAILKQPHFGFLVVQNKASDNGFDFITCNPLILSTFFILPKFSVIKCVNVKIFTP